MSALFPPADQRKNGYSTLVSAKQHVFPTPKPAIFIFVLFGPIGHGIAASTAEQSPRKRVLDLYGYILAVKVVQKCPESCIDGSNASCMAAAVVMDVYRTKTHAKISFHLVVNNWFLLQEADFHNIIPIRWTYTSLVCSAKEASFRTAGLFNAQKGQPRLFP